MTETTTPRCAGCGHDQHQPGTECSAGVYHGERTFHLCLCLARPDANRACPEQMHCQGGTLRYAEVWYQQQGLTPIPEDEEPASAPKPTTVLFQTPGVKAFAEAIDVERQAQLAKWGEQHHPDIDTRDIAYVTHHYYAGRADIWRQVNEERATPSSGSRCMKCPPLNTDEPHTHTAWDGILLEEVYEALAESDPVKLRAELVQAAAVISNWIDDIDSRPASASDSDQRPEATR